jgi:hypothetical protein
LFKSSGKNIKKNRFFSIDRACYVKMGRFYLTLCVKMGYNVPMFGRMVSIILRLLLITVFWAFIWQIVEPRTQLRRILRAALLLLGLLGILAVLRFTGA